MNLGDGLLFELENGKPKLIVLSHAGVEKNPVKQLAFRPRAAKILSPRQPSCVEEVQVERPARQQAGKRRHARVKAGGAATSFTSSITADGGISTSLAVSKTREHHTAGGGAKAEPKVKSDRHQQSSTVGSLKAGGKKGQLQTQGGGKERLKDTLANGDAGLRDSMVCLTSEQLQRILNTVQTSSNGQNPPADHRKQGTDRNEADSKSGSLVNDRGGGEIKEEDGGGGGGGEEIKKGGGVTDRAGTSQDKDNRSSGCVFSWLEERQSVSRTAMDAKKAQWRRELSEQVALKQQQQRSAPGRLQAEDDAESVLSVRSSSSHREQPAAIRSSLRLGEFTPMEEVLSVERKEEQRRRWLEELDRQRDEMTERKRREKVLQNQTEDHELWATHFDSLHRRPPPVQTAAPSVPPAAPSVPPAAPSAPPAAPHCESERREWEPSSSLSLVWEATSSCGAESVGGASVDTTSGHPTKTSYLRTMTALLDPVQIEEREKRRLKQLEQQRAIEAQVEERRRQREQEEAKRREEEEEEERRVALEREMLQRQYEMDTLREKQKEEPSHEGEEPNEGQDYGNLQETQEPRVSRQTECVEVKVSSPVFPLKDTAVQTEEAAPFQTSEVSAQNQPPPSLSAAPPNNRNRAGRTGKENICRPAAAGGGGRGRGGGGGGGDPYEEFARTERNRREKRRPEWNTQRPSRRFVPASERYPAALQRNRQENRLKRQAELLALQEKTRLPRTDPPAPNQEPRLCSNPSQTRTSSARRVESVSRRQGVSAAVYTERGRSPPVPAVRHTVQSQQASTSPPPLEFIPYVRTDEVFNLNPLDPADTPPPHIPTEAPQRSASPPPPSHRDPLLHPELLRNSHTHRQQEILRGLAQLRQGLLQKQRELETDLNPRLKRHDNKLRSPSTTHHM
ncbi:coiled-coil domain-containing protein 66 isoform X4 [Scomber scombrus]|uniref:coiled-coil domain-containing protein 66 isoform X4 n=1 Tax=Scomber scombrus TaxID=13677 RepID=UPI002DDB6D9F|nr:coiled-coil domain-containing protein 66 isoform X4 [Scomber scombrus]